MLRKYGYEFEWKHTGAASIITSMTVRTPLAGSHVETTVNGAAIYGILDDTPVVHVRTIMGLQHIEAMVEEIKCEKIKQEKLYLIANESVTLKGRD